MHSLLSTSRLLNQLTLNYNELKVKADGIISDQIISYQIRSEQTSWIHSLLGFMEVSPGICVGGDKQAAWVVHQTQAGIGNLVV